MIPSVSWLDLASPDVLIATRLSDDSVGGNVSGFELDVINRLVAPQDREVIFEIGAFDGRTLLNLAANSRPARGGLPGAGAVPEGCGARGHAPVGIDGRSTAARMKCTAHGGHGPLHGHQRHLPYRYCLR
jgi:hypothetical protein